jgi:hypothetical protein
MRKYGSSLKGEIVLPSVSIEDLENLNYAIQTANNNNVANRIGLNTFYVTDVGLEQYYAFSCI